VIKGVEPQKIIFFKLFLIKLVNPERYESIKVPHLHI